MADQLVTYVAQMLCENPGAVSAVTENHEDASIINLAVNTDDRGRVIGRGGQTAEALRALVRAAGAVRDKRVQLKIVDE